MVIRHSLKILEQLSEIENFISKIERFMEQKGIELDREKLLRGLVKERKEMMISGYEKTRARDSKK